MTPLRRINGNYCPDHSPVRAPSRTAIRIDRFRFQPVRGRVQPLLFRLRFSRVTHTRAPAPRTLPGVFLHTHTGHPPARISALLFIFPVLLSESVYKASAPGNGIIGSDLKSSLTLILTYHILLTCQQKVAYLNVRAPAHQPQIEARKRDGEVGSHTTRTGFYMRQQSWAILLNRSRAKPRH